ncbi:MAG TPA: hypothetical protein VMI73_16825 [Trebonia sp.]|nr:hypothetical protein [Trebonia sp.]
MRLTAAGREHVKANRDHYTARYPDVRIPDPDHPIARHRADPAQLARDAQHRADFFAPAEAAVTAREAGKFEEAARIQAQADACGQPAACGHWQRGVQGATCR